MEEAYSESKYDHRLQASLFKYEPIQFKTVNLREYLIKEMLLSIPCGFVCSYSSELCRNPTSLNNLAWKEHK